MKVGNKKSKSFTQGWWESMYEKSCRMTIPTAIDDAIVNDDVLTLKDSIYEMLQNIKKENDFLGCRVWINGKLKKKYNNIIASDPIRNNNDLICWQKRHFSYKRFGLILNFAHRYSGKAREKILSFITPLLKDRIPYGGIGFTVFIGNYGWTPLGIHQDHTGSFVIHFHLGPGEKTMYMWEHDNYKNELDGRENEQSVDEYLPYYDYKLIFREGSVFFMPWNYYHIGYSPELSLGLTIWFNYSTIDGVLNGIWENIFKSNYNVNSKKSETRVRNLKSISDEYNIESIFDLFDGESLSSPTRDILIESIEDYKDSLKSNNWFDKGAIKSKQKKITFKENGKIISNKRYIEYKVVKKKDVIKIFSNGRFISMKYHKDMEELLNRIKKSESITISRLISGLFVDWPEGIAYRIVEILYENGFIEYQGLSE